jgi:FkbM family methyltransferase
MIFNKDGIAFPDYQKQRGAIFRDTSNHDLRQWRYCQKLFKNTRLCLDFGGHVGTSAIQYSTLFDNVFSFEPIPALYECLEYNTRDIENILINNIAIGNKNEEVTIYINPENSGANVVQSESTQKIIDTRWNNQLRRNFVKEKPIKVECRTIDSFNFNHVDFIKIDTEGYNLEPLIGMQETLKRCSPVIQLERAVPHIEEPQRFLEDFGYKLVNTIVLDDIFVREE